MSNREYFEEVLSILDNMSDEEFDDLLIRAGIEECPFEGTLYSEVSINEVTMVVGQYEMPPHKDKTLTSEVKVAYGYYDVPVKGINLSAKIEGIVSFQVDFPELSSKQTSYLNKDRMYKTNTEGQKITTGSKVA